MNSRVPAQPRCFMNVFIQRMAVQGDDQRQRIGMDKLNAVFVINVLLPEGQMHFNRVEVVAPFIGIVSCDAITGDGARHAEHGVALCVQIEGDRRSRSPVGPGVNWERLRVSR